MCVHVHPSPYLSVLPVNHTIIHRGSGSKKALKTQILGLPCDFNHRVGLNQYDFFFTFFVITSLSLFLSLNDPLGSHCAGVSSLFPSVEIIS